VLKFLNFRYHGNMGMPEKKFKDTFTFADLVNPHSGARISDCEA